jgi:general secretion pathway protein D
VPISDRNPVFACSWRLLVSAAACLFFCPGPGRAQSEGKADVAAALDQMEVKRAVVLDAQSSARTLLSGSVGAAAILPASLVVDLTGKEGPAASRVLKDDQSDLPAPEPVILDTLELRDMDINDVLKLLAQKSGLNIIAGKSITGRVTIFLTRVDVRDALMIILKANDLAFIEDKGVLQIVTAAEYEQVNGRKFGSRLLREMVTLQSLKALDAVAILTQIKSPEGKIVADERSNTVYIEDSAEKVKYLEEYLRMIDLPVESRMFKLEHTQAETLAGKVSDLLGSKSGTVKFDALSNKLFVTDTARNLAMIERVVRQLDVARDTAVFKLSYAKAETILASITPMLTKDIGHAEVDARSNTVIVTDILPKIDQVRTVVRSLDAVDRQVLIEARILEVGLTDKFKMGIDWQTIIPNFHNFKFHSNNGFGLGSAVSEKGVMSIGTMNASDYAATIEAISGLVNTHILSNPRIAVVNNQEAQILIGTTKPYVTTTTTTTSTGPTVSETVNFIDVGVKLFVTPNIHDDGYVTMKIKPEVSTASTSVITSQKNEIPIVDTSKVETTVRVKDGITIIIGGLIKDELTNVHDKVPVLGDIPVLGRVFRHDTRDSYKKEIVIFLTPHIITGDVAADPDVRKTPPP